MRAELNAMATEAETARATAETMLQRERQGAAEEAQLAAAQMEALRADAAAAEEAARAALISATAAAERKAATANAAAEVRHLCSVNRRWVVSFFFFCAMAHHVGNLPMCFVKMCNVTCAG